MDPQVSSSFIPKKPLTGERGSRGGLSGFILLIAILVFIASGLAAGGVFLYGRLMDSSLQSKKKSLETARGAYDPGVIEELIRLDERMKQARLLLDAHVAPSSIFLLLAEQTLEDVQFTSFDYLLKEDGTASILLDGQAKDFSTVALQSDQFGASKVLKEVVFADINISESSGVTFSVSAIIDPTSLLYSKNLANSAFAPVDISPVEDEPIATTTPTL